MSDADRRQRIDAMIDSQITNIERQLEQGNLAAAQMHADVMVSLTRARPMEVIEAAALSPQRIDEDALLHIVNAALNIDQIPKELGRVVVSAILSAQRSGNLWVK